MKSHIEISKDNLIHNLSLFHQLSQKKIMFIVKANAYGHGLKQIAEITRDIHFIDYYGVDSLNEALIVREIDNKKKILIIGWADDDELKQLILNHFEIIAPSIDYLKKMNEIARDLALKPKVHVKLETGTSRLGIEFDKIADVFDSYQNIDIVGVYSHFANIEDSTDHSFARQQLKIFNDFISRTNGRNLLKHFSCSAAALLFPQTYFDIIRVGISAYGYWPSKEIFVSFLEKNRIRIEFKPVLSWYAKIAQVKYLDKGKFIGYGLTYKTFSKSKIVVIPIGYYDGYDRKLSNISKVIIRGRQAPVRGRICMDMFMVDVTHLKNIRQGDKVILIGEENTEKIDADYLAELIGTINYEVLARINPLIPRLIV